MFLGKNSIDKDIAEAVKVNTLRITIITVVILTGIVFVYDMVFGVRSDERIKQFLDSPSVRERFNNSENSRIKSIKKVESPLVQQAETFSSFQNFMASRLDFPVSIIAAITSPSKSDFEPTTAPKRINSSVIS